MSNVAKVILFLIFGVDEQITVCRGGIGNILTQQSETTTKQLPMLP